MFWWGWLQEPTCWKMSSDQVRQNAWERALSVKTGRDILWSVKCSSPVLPFQDASSGLLSSPSGHELRKNLKLAEMSETVIWAILVVLDKTQSTDLIHKAACFVLCLNQQRQITRGRGYTRNNKCYQSFIASPMLWPSLPFSSHCSNWNATAIKKHWDNLAVASMMIKF